MIRPRDHLFNNQIREVEEPRKQVVICFEVNLARMHGLVANDTEDVAELRQSASGWGAANGHARSGNYLGDARPGPQDLLVQLYEANDQGVVGMDAVARDQYSKLSAVSHGLPQALTQYMVDSDDSDHGHMRLDSPKLLAPFAVLVTAHEAAIRRLFSFFGWTVTTELEGELFAIRLWWNRASGLVEGD